MTVATAHLLSTDYPAELTPGARSAVITCLRIDPKEKVTLITDRVTEPIAAALGAQLAEQIDGGGQRKLRGAETGDKVAAANAAAFFQSLEHVVNRAEAAGNIFRGDGFAQQHAVAIEQLQGERVTGFGLRGA